MTKKVCIEAKNIEHSILTSLFSVVASLNFSRESNNKHRKTVVNLM